MQPDLNSQRSTTPYQASLVAFLFCSRSQLRLCILAQQRDRLKHYFSKLRLRMNLWVDGNLGCPWRRCPALRLLKTLSLLEYRCEGSDCRSTSWHFSFVVSFFLQVVWHLARLFVIMAVYGQQRTFLGKAKIFVAVGSFPGNQTFSQI